MANNSCKNIFPTS